MNYDSNLDRLTVIDLRAIAADLEIAGRSKMKRAELVAAITEAEAEINATAVPAEPSVYEDPAVRAAIRETIAEQADAEAGELLDAVLGEYVEPTADTGKIAITKYSAHEAIATAVFGTDSIAGHVTRNGGRWELRDGVRKIRAKTLSKVAKQWAKALAFHATTIDVETMS